MNKLYLFNIWAGILNSYPVSCVESLPLVFTPFLHNFRYQKHLLVYKTKCTFSYKMYFEEEKRKKKLLADVVFLLNYQTRIISLNIFIRVFPI